MIVSCAQAASPVIEFLTDERHYCMQLRFGTIDQRIDSDHPTPFYEQSKSVVWLGESAPEQISIESSAEVARCVFDYDWGSDPITLQFLDDALAKERAGDVRGC